MSLGLGHAQMFYDSHLSASQEDIKIWRVLGGS